MIMVKMISIKTKIVFLFSFYGLENLSSVRLCKEQLPSALELLKATATPSCLWYGLSNRLCEIIECRQFSTEVINSKTACLVIYTSRFMLLITLKSSFWIKANICSYNSCVFVCCSGVGMFMNLSAHPHHHCSPQCLVSTQWVIHLTSFISMTAWMFGSTDILKDGLDVDLDVECQGWRTLHETSLPKQLNDYWECVQQHQRHILQTIYLPFSPLLTACYLS